MKGKDGDGNRAKITIERKAVKRGQFIVTEKTSCKVPNTHVPKPLVAFLTLSASKPGSYPCKNVNG
jgi:hypothetical protein